MTERRKDGRRTGGRADGRTRRTGRTGRTGLTADVAVETGSYHLTGLGPKGDIEDRGRFLTVWKKVDGEWKVAYDMGATTMPAAQ
jgi:ketosteroid isomerase-like protein